MKTRLALAAAVAAATLASAPALAQGADLCANAQAISGEGSFSTNSIGAGTDGPSPCAGLGSDVWFAWTATDTDAFQITTCTFANYDTALSVYSGTCGSLQLLACNDDTCGLQSTVNVAATAGTTYLIQVGGFQGDSGNATMTIAVNAGGLGGCTNPSSGADVIVGVIPATRTWGASGNMSGYSLGTTSCNVGDVPLDWFANNTQHPVIGQNIYRIEDGRFEQVGMGWLKHGFFALQGNACCSCNPNPNGQRLGVGCSDPYGASLNGSQGGLGPRFQVNAFTGEFAYPFFADGLTGDAVYKRVQVLTDDLDPALHPTATYVGEAQYITPDDAGAGNGANNVSWVPLSRSGAVSQGAFRLEVSGATVREQPAIQAWQVAHPGVVLAEVTVPGEGQFVAGCNAIDNGDGTWRYEYAIFNNNSDLSGHSFSIPTGAGVSVTDVGMSFPLYHSGEPYTNVPWTSSVGVDEVTWTADATFAQNEDANALRWGTTYSFWFTADSGPEQADGSLGLFKPTALGPQPVPLLGPSALGGGSVTVANYCIANPNSTGQPGIISATNFDLVGRTMELTATSLPPGQFGIFLTSLTSGFTPNLGGGQGNLCLDVQVGRRVGGVVLLSDAGGQFSLTASLDAMPTPTQVVVVQPGETRYFQAWHRDLPTLLGPTSNLTDGVEVNFP